MSQSILDRLAHLVDGLSIVSVCIGSHPDAALSISPDASRVTIGSSEVAAVTVIIHPGRVVKPLQALRGKTYHCTGEMQFLASLLVEEVTAPRCGAQALLAAYARALIIHLLRDELASGRMKTGLLAGLADARLSKALVAIHDDPARSWNIEGLAERAGMSRAAFMRSFSACVGETPMGYLRRWRLECAREALLAGERVARVANIYGYASVDAFSRAFRAAEGMLPSELRTGLGPA